MIRNLLEAEGIKGRVDGEFLSGGVGELQVIGIVQVAVADEDYEAAKGVIAKWEAEQPDEEPSANKPKSYGVVFAFCIGVVFGAGLVLLVAINV